MEETTENWDARDAIKLLKIVREIYHMNGLFQLKCVIIKCFNIVSENSQLKNLLVKQQNFADLKKFPCFIHFVMDII